MALVFLKRSQIQRIIAAAMVVGLGGSGCSEFRFDPSNSSPHFSNIPEKRRGRLGILYPSDERPSENANPVAVGAFLPVPYVGLTIDRPERFLTMANNDYGSADRPPLGVQLQEVVVQELNGASVFDSILPVAASSNFKHLACDGYLKLALRSTRAKGNVPTYFVTYLGAIPLYLAGFPFWVGTQELFIDAELLDGDNLEPVWKKSYNKTSEKSWRGLYFYGKDPRRAGNKLLGEFTREMIRDLRTFSPTHSKNESVDQPLRR
jgi:hypothetical protein